MNNSFKTKMTFLPPSPDTSPSQHRLYLLVSLPPAGRVLPRLEVGHQSDGLGPGGGHGARGAGRGQLLAGLSWTHWEPTVNILSNLFSGKLFYVRPQIFLNVIFVSVDREKKKNI